jgi:outer membrane protein assembly factor BamD (BamD/ComL family)
VLAWLKQHPKAPDRDRGIFLLAEAYYQYGDRIRAFYHLDELMDLHPESRLFYPAMEKQFEIADRFLGATSAACSASRCSAPRRKRSTCSSASRSGPPDRRWPSARLLRTADYYYSRGQYDLAADAYAAYARSYPRSPVIPRVKLRQAFASLAQFRGRYYDVTPLIDARAQLEAIQSAYPDLAEKEGIASVLARIDKSMADKLYWTANFYRRTHEPRAAAYTFRYLINRYPTSPEADLARRHLDRLPQWALATPSPSAAPESDEQILLDPPTR